MTEGYRESVPVLTFPRQTFVSLLVFALIWEALSYLAPYLGIPPFAIPSLVRIAKSIATITPVDIVVTLGRVIAALIVSFLLGIALAMAMYRSDSLDKYLHPISAYSWRCQSCHGSCSQSCGFPVSSFALPSCWWWFAVPYS